MTVGIQGGERDHNSTVTLPHLSLLRQSFSHASSKTNVTHFSLSQGPCLVTQTSLDNFNSKKKSFSSSVLLQLMHKLNSWTPADFETVSVRHPPTSYLELVDERGYVKPKSWFCSSNSTLQ